MVSGNLQQSKLGQDLDSARKKNEATNLPANFLISLLHISSLSILYVGFCAFPYRLGLLLFDYLDRDYLLRLVLMADVDCLYAIYIYPIVLLVEESGIAKQYDVSFSRVDDVGTILTLHSNEILHCSLNFHFLKGKKLFFSLRQCYSYFHPEVVSHEIFRLGTMINCGMSNGKRKGFFVVSEGEVVCVFYAIESP